VGVPLLIGIGVFVIATLVGALARVRYSWIGIVGAVLGLGFWAIMAVIIYRGPDNPDLGERGWTIAAGGLAGLYVAAWLIGAAAGRALRGRSSRASVSV
jgi:hypothetical protein